MILLIESLSTLVVVFLVALAVSMALIPVMMRLAPHIGMLDKPDPRKVHAVPIPRAGGIGIVLGALLPMVIWLPLNDTFTAFYAGSIVLLVFGVWDDIAELGHYVKFVGQFAAAILVVYAGDVVVTNLPFMNMVPIPEAVGRPFTVIALVGMINAINHSDGLDGLAGGESLISLAGILYLASQSSGNETMVLAVAVMGGVFGFLRFNSHPARVFMGDGGSQFLGYSLGVMAVLLSQDDNTALSPMVPLLLLGLPIADILVVLWKRARSGGNWFKATKNHIHHRLLELGFHHYESVAIIYTIQAALVFLAVFAPYSSDMVLAASYIGACILLFATLRRAEASGWRARVSGITGSDSGSFLNWLGSSAVIGIPGMVVMAGVSIFMLVQSVAVTHVPVELAVIGLILAVTLLARLIFGYRLWFLLLRLIIYMSIALLVFLSSRYDSNGVLGEAWMSYLFYGILGLAIIAGIRMSERDRFRVTPLDYLVVLIAFALAMVPESSLQSVGLVEMALRAILLFYGAELAMRQMRSRWNAFTVSILASLGIVALRGILA